MWLCRMVCSRCGSTLISAAIRPDTRAGQFSSASRMVLPISSSAHLLILSQLFGWEDPGAAFTAVTQIGTEIEWAIRQRPHQWFCFRRLWDA